MGDREQVLREIIESFPDFWLTVMKKDESVKGRILRCDDPILKHLTDIKVKYAELNPQDFTLEFYFAPNDFFYNDVLTLQYEMKAVPADDVNHPDLWERCDFTCKGCTINWKKGKNVTLDTIFKKLKPNSRGTVHTITKYKHNYSFFNLFNPEEIPEDDDDGQLDGLKRIHLNGDLEAVNVIKDRIVPFAETIITGSYFVDFSSSEEDGNDEEEMDSEYEGC